MDLEHSLDPHMLETSGVDISKLMIAQPESTEDTLTILDELLEVDEIPLIVVDSVAGMGLARKSPGTTATLRWPFRPV